MLRGRVLFGACLLLSALAAGAQPQETGSIAGHIRLTARVRAPLPANPYPSRAIGRHEAPAAPEIRNVVVYRWPNGLDIDQPSGAAGGGLTLSGEICTQLGIGNGVGDNTVPANLDNLGLSFRFGLLAGNTNAGATDGSDPGGPPGGPGTTPPFTCGGYTHGGTDLEAAYIGTASNHLVTSSATTGVMVDAENTITPDFRPVSGGPITTTTATATPVGDPFWDPSGGSYVGAVAPGSAVPWYAGWTRGWQAPTTP